MMRYTLAEVKAGRYWIADNGDGRPPVPMPLGYSVTLHADKMLDPDNPEGPAVGLKPGTVILVLEPEEATAQGWGREPIRSDGTNRAHPNGGAQRPDGSSTEGPG